MLHGPCHPSSSVEADVLEVVVLEVEADWLGEWKQLLCTVSAAEFNLPQHVELCSVCVHVCVCERERKRQCDCEYVYAYGRETNYSYDYLIVYTL